jgi:glycosyltransferase involved in cell wall biosynthesis
MADPESLPTISVVIPCRNEERFIGRCLDSVLDNRYPDASLEILVVDGMSDDRTREIVEDYASRCPSLRCLDNPKRRTPWALNIGIEAASGTYIARVDAHAEIAHDYLVECVRHLEEWDADNVGGPMATLPRDDTHIGRGIVAVLSHKFGVGGSHFRTSSKEPKWVDTVFGGFFPKDVFRRVGLFNEGLVRGQDMEFNLRLAKQGGRILLAPRVRSSYHARTDYLTFVRHNWTNGVWAIIPIIHSEVFPVSVRHLVPLAFVVMLPVTLGLWLGAPLWVAALASLPVGVYLALNLLASIDVMRKFRSPILGLVAPPLFATLHLTYGAGSLIGVLKLVGYYLSRGLSRLISRGPRPL